MTHYCGIDLHSNNHVLTVIDDQDKADDRVGPAQAIVKQDYNYIKQVQFVLKTAFLI